MLLIPLMTVSAKMGLDMMIGNDNMTFGLGRNLDDGKSFGAEIDLTFDNHYVSASLSGITVRGYTTEEGLVQGRYDSFNIGYGYRFNWKFGHEELELQPFAGFDLLGNLGMEWVQNLVHKVIGKQKVSLPYDYDTPIFLPILAVEAGWIHDFSNGFSLGIYDELSYRIHFGLHNDVGLLFRFGERFDLSFGYAYEQDLTEGDSCYGVQAARYSGFMMKSSVHAGIFTLEYLVNFSEGISFGLMGFNPLAFMDMESFNDTGRSLAVGGEYGWRGYMHRLTLTDHNWQFRSKYIGGELEVGSDRRVGNASFAIGYSFLWELGHFSPFVSPWAGMSQYLYFRQDRVLNQLEMLVEHYMPTIGCDVGVRMLEKGTVCVGGSSFSVDAGVSLGWNIGEGNVDVNGFEEFRKKMTPFEARVFIDLVFYI